MRVPTLLVSLPLPFTDGREFEPWWSRLTVRPEQPNHSREAAERLRVSDRHMCRRLVSERLGLAPNVAGLGRSDALPPNTID